MNETVESAEDYRDGILMCAACRQRPASRRLLLPGLLRRSTFGVVHVCTTCALKLLAAEFAEAAYDADEGAV